MDSWGRSLLTIASATWLVGCGNPRVAGLPDGSLPDAGPSSDGGDAGTLADAGDGGPSVLNVLFIGDSYTYVNDLPGMLQQIAATAGVPPTIATGQVAVGGATLEDQWDGGVAEAQIRAQPWDYVVLQGQSEEPLFTGDGFVTYAEQFESLILDVGARPALFVTWARAAGDSIYTPGTDGYLVSPQMMQDELTAAYDSLASQQPDDVLVCAGPAFQLAISQYPAIALQQADLSHPTVAGTYLAACTFYVALTGRPVPSESAVPDGLSAEDAAHLRQIAQIGTNCSGVTPKGAAVLNAIQALSEYKDGEPDGGPVAGSGGGEFDGGFDFGAAGISIPAYFSLTNLGPTAVGVTDELTLTAPFSWSDGVGYPGGTGSAEIEGSSYPFCTSTLPPVLNNLGSACVIAVTYSGAATGSGTLTLGLSDAYEASLLVALRGEATPRALLTVSDDQGFFGCSDDTCGPASMQCGAPLNLVVTNRGGSPTTTLDVGTPLGSAFYWGSGPDAGAFPGGAGIGSVDGESYPYCATGTLGAGEQCLITLGCPETALLGSAVYTSVNLSYADEAGPVSPNAGRGVIGHGPLPP